PSIHPNGKAYKWEVALTPELPALPPELLKLISSPTTDHGNSYRQRFNTADALKGVPEGQRDDVVFRFACKLRSADVPQDVAENLILESAKNCQPHFSEKIALEKVSRAYSRYSANQKEPELWPEFLTAKDILQAPKDPTRWIVNGCLPTGGGS